MKNSHTIYEERGFLIKKGTRIYVNPKKTSSIILNQLHVDILQKLQDRFGGRLLDAGCGEKPYSLIYGSLAKEVIGCDVETCVHDQSQVDVFASLDSLPFKEDYFDTIICTNVLEHVAEMENAIKELSRVAKKNATVIVSVPFLYPTHEAPYDYYRCTIYGLQYQLLKHGFAVKKIIPLGGIGLLGVVYLNFIFTRLIPIKVIQIINCELQKWFYIVYKRVCFKKLFFGGLTKMSSIASCGYVIEAEKVQA